MSEEKIKMNTKITLRKDQYQFMELTIEQAEDIFNYLSKVLHKTPVQTFGPISRSSNIFNKE